MDRCDHCENEVAVKKCFDCCLFYCEACAETVHSKGKLQLHKIIDTEEDTIKCEVCNDAEIYVKCEDCEIKYCQSCSEKFHKKGALIYHKIEKVHSNELPSLKGHFPWEDTKFGWFPHPKNEKCEFSNSILKNYYEQTFNSHADPDHFRKQFITECNRQWEIQKQCKHVEHTIEYIKGVNPNAIGNFLGSGKLKPGDDKTLDYNISKLKNLESVIKKEKETIQKNEELIHDSTGRILLKTSFTIQHNFNLDMITKLNSCQAELEKTLEKCRNICAKYDDLFGKKLRPGRTEKGASKKRKIHNKRKAYKRNMNRLQSTCRYLVDNLISSDISLEYLDFSKTQCLHTLVNKKGCKFQTDLVDLDFVHTLGLKHVKGLFLLLETNLFTFQAKCLILQNMKLEVETKYWKYHMDFYETERSDFVEDVEMSDQENENGDSESEEDMSGLSETE